MKHIFALIAVVFTLTACNGGGGGNSSDDGSAGGTEPKGTLFETPAVKNSTSLAHPDSILGLWESETINGNGVDMRLRIKFAPTKAVATTACFYNDGTSLYVQVTVAVSYPDDGSFQVLQNAEKTIKHEVNGNTYDCSAHVEAGLQYYDISQGTIVTQDGMLMTKIGN